MVLYQKGQFGPKQKRILCGDHSKQQRTLETPVSCQTMFNCHIYGKKPSVIQYLNQIKQDSYHANISQDKDANKRNLTWVFTRLLLTKLFEVELEPMTANQQKIPS